MNTSYPLERLLTSVIFPIATFSAAIAALCLATPGNALTEITASATLPPTAAVLTKGMVNDYQPPDNGGPGKTGGSGTRWR